MDLKEEFETELLNILDYWITYTQDKEKGGFYGKIDRFNQVDTSADKGSVLNSRILWTFSAAYNSLGRSQDRMMAERSFDYLKAHFADPDFGGVFWTVNAGGFPEDGKKQIYAQAFAIYGLSEYYRASGNPEALELATEIYQLIEKHSFDPVFNGYLEAFERNWMAKSDLRLSEKDANEKKSMNTHLHVLEAYCNLYTVWPDKGLKEKTQNLIDLFLDHIIDPATSHQTLFFDEKWIPRSTTVSYGHDIETAWLLYKAAEIAGTPEQILQVKNQSVKMALAAMEGFDQDGSMCYEYDPVTGHRDGERQWWVQAETVVGFLYAFRLNQKPEFYNRFLKTWNYIKNNIIDTKNGEWIWGIDQHGNVMEQEDKVGLWKCPYHNARMCMEAKRVLSFLNQ